MFKLCGDGIRRLCEIMAELRTYVKLEVLLGSTVLTIRLVCKRAPRAHAAKSASLANGPPFHALCGCNSFEVHFSRVRPLCADRRHHDRRRDQSAQIHFRRIYRRHATLRVYYGGGWAMGDNVGDAPSRAISKSGKVLVVSVKYSLAPLNKHPGLKDDCYKAMQWALKNYMFFFYIYRLHCTIYC
jgi:hypothetical protein